ncbi:MAG: type VI-B CRISPR-associated RNA-guided ribonuclease Cas13b [Bacteroidota bacterium]
MTSPTKAHKSIFAPYLNLALHNVDLIFKEITSKLKLKAALEKEENPSLPLPIYFLLLTKEDEARHKSILALLSRYLPWIEILQIEAEKNTSGSIAENVGTHLENWIERLNTERNYHAHFYYDESSFENLEPSKRIHINSTWREAQRLVEQSEERKEKIVEYKAVNATTFEKVTFQGHSEHQFFTLDGLIFFTCLFLQRSEALYFINLFEDYKVKNVTEYDEINKAKILIFTAFCAQLPQPKMQSGALHLDMLGELMRVPDEVFRNWEEDQQNTFVTYDNEDFDEGLEQIIRKRTVMKRSDDRFPYFALRWLEEINAFQSLRFHIHLGKFEKDRRTKLYNGVTQERIIQQTVRTFAKLSEFPMRKELEEKQEEWSWTYRKKTLDFPEFEQYAPRYHITGNRIGLRFTKEEDRQYLSVNDPLKPDAILSTYELPNLCIYQLLYQKYQAAVEDITRIRTNINKNRPPSTHLPLLLSPEHHIRAYIAKLHHFYDAFLEGKIKQFHSKDKDLKLDEDMTDKEREKWLDGKRMTPQQRESILNRRLEQYQKKVLDPYGIQWHYLTDDLKDYLMKRKSDAFKFEVKDALKKKIKATERRQKALDRYDKILKEKPTLANRLLTEQLQAARLPRVGELATWLARDITYFKPTSEEANNNGKPTNTQYRTLQSTLALFNPYKRASLKEQFQLIQLVDSKARKIAHPFLYNVNLNHCETIIDFYRQYLKARSTWLEQLLERVDKKKKGDREGIKTLVEHALPLKNLGRLTTAEIKDKVRRYKEQTVLLPRGFFNENIKEILYFGAGAGKISKGQITPFPFEFKDLTGTTQRIKTEDNIVRLWRLYLGDLRPEYYTKDRIYQIGEESISDVKIDQQHSFQSFMDMRKDYRKQAPERMSKADYEKLSDDKQKERDQKQDNYRRQSRFYKIIAENEKIIRYRKHTDRILWMMIKEWAENKDDIVQAFDLNLGNIQHIGFDQQSVAHKKPLLSLPVHGRSIYAEIYLRQYGLFRRFAKDQRLADLFDYFPDGDNIRMEILREELKIYDEKRKDLMEIVLRFEEVIFNKHEKALIKKKHKNHINHSKQLSFFEDTYGKVANTDMLKAIRSSFSHNDFPKAAEMPSQMVEKLRNQRKQHLENIARQQEVLATRQEQLRQAAINFERLSSEQQRVLEEKETQLKSDWASWKQQTISIQPPIAAYWIEQATAEYRSMIRHLKKS